MDPFAEDDVNLPEPLDKAQAKAAFMLRLRARGIRSLDVLRAVETVPRDIFVPHHYIDLAAREMSLPIACGQIMPEPWLVARQMEALGAGAGDRVLEIGTGTGYATAILARLTSYVLSLERFNALVLAAQERMHGLGFKNVTIVWADGLRLPPEAGLFDRILIHGALEKIPGSILGALAPSGVLIAARPDPEHAFKQKLVRITRSGDDSLHETTICSCRLGPLIPGKSLHL